MYALLGQNETGLNWLGTHETIEECNLQKSSYEITPYNAYAYLVVELKLFELAQEYNTMGE